MATKQTMVNEICPTSTQDWVKRCIAGRCKRKRGSRRAIIAMLYLKIRGFTVKYLDDGLTGLAEYLRGDNAKVFINK